MLSKLTIAGLHNFALSMEDDLWQNLDLPEGIDKDSFINEVLRQASEFSVLYPDYDFMKYQIGAWSKKWKKNFERWYKAYLFEYEALYNVDVTTVIEEHGKNQSDGSKSSSGSNSFSNLGTSDGSNSDTVTNKKAAFDSSTFQNVTQTESYGSTSLSSSETHSGSDTHSESMTDSSSHDITTTEIKRGNQGITMSQELLMAEMNVWCWNLYQHMAEVFVTEFCICVYA